MGYDTVITAEKFEVTDGRLEFFNTEGARVAAFARWDSVTHVNR